MMNIKYSNGYTLIELLVAMTVIITVGLIIVAILVSSLRGTSKATSIENVRINGNYAILQMSRMIEFAQSFGGASLDGSTYSITCPSVSPNPTYKYIKITSFDNGQTILSCNSPLLNPQTIASQSGAIVPPVSLIDTNNVLLSNCYFTCSRTTVSQPPTIGINFTLSQKSSSSFFEKQALIPFSTSVVIRNLNK